MLEAEIEVFRLRVWLERRKIGTQMKMPNLQGVGPALAQLQAETEDDAKKFIESVRATRTRKNAVFGRGNEQLAGVHVALDEVNGFIDELDKATNGGPTLGDSAGSPVSALPSEGAQLSEVK